MSDQSYISDLRSAFIRGEVAAIITEDSERPFLEWCESVGIRWCAGGERPTEWVPSYNGGYDLQNGSIVLMMGGRQLVVGHAYHGTAESKLHVYAEDIIYEPKDDISVDDAALCQLLQ